MTTSKEAARVAFFLRRGKCSEEVAKRGWAFLAALGGRLEPPPTKAKVAFPPDARVVECGDLERPWVEAARDANEQFAGSIRDALRDMRPRRQKLALDTILWPSGMRAQAPPFTHMDVGDSSGSSKPSLGPVPICRKDGVQGGTGTEARKDPRVSSERQALVGRFRCEESDISGLPVDMGASEETAPREVPGMLPAPPLVVDRMGQDPTPKPCGDGAPRRGESGSIPAHPSATTSKGQDPTPRTRNEGQDPTPREQAMGSSPTSAESRTAEAMRRTGQDPTPRALNLGSPFRSHLDQTLRSDLTVGDPRSRVEAGRRKLFPSANFEIFCIRPWLSWQNELNLESFTITLVAVEFIMSLAATLAVLASLAHDVPFPLYGFIDRYGGILHVREDVHSKQARTPPPWCIWCPAGHDCRGRRAEDYGYFCDKCGLDILERDTIYDCRRCDFSSCLWCARSWHTWC